MNISYYKEQLQAKENMLAATTRFLVDQQETVALRNRTLESAQQEINASIRMSELIQTSLRPDPELFGVFFKSAAFYISQQIGIGGDAVLAKNTSRGLMFGLLDSTGHGIPAAMLSIAGTLIFQQIIDAMGLKDPAVCTRLLNGQLLKNFNQQQYNVANMEGTICFYSSETGQLSYCSAKGKPWLIRRNGVVEELPCDKQVIGTEQDPDFRNRAIDFEPGDKLFLFSDGLTDQFGGIYNKKFSRRRLKTTVEDLALLPVEQIKAGLTEAISEWKGETLQTDDISFLLIQL